MSELNQVSFIEVPKYKCNLIIGGKNGLCIALHKVPCKFHRIMQKIFFGFEYEIL